MAARRIGVDPEAVQRALAEQRVSPDASGAVSGRDQERRLPGHVKVEREALQLLLTRTREMAPWVDSISESDFTSPPRRELYRAARALVTSNRPPSVASMADGMSPDALSLLTELTVGAEIAPDDELAARVEEVFVRIKVFSLEREIKKRRERLHDINPVVDPKEHDDLFTELVGLEAERRDLLRRVRGAA